MAIKLTKQNHTNDYNQSEVRWVVSGSKHLTNHYVIKGHYTWELRSNDGKLHPFSMDNYYRTKAQIVDYLNSYDVIYDEYLQQIEDEKQRELQERQDELNKIKSVNDSLTMDNDYSEILNVDDFIFFKLFNWSKVNSVGEAVTGGFTKAKGKIQEIRQVSNKVYDCFVTNLLDNNKHGLTFSGGGSSCDDEKYSGYKLFHEMPTHLQDSYAYDSYEVVTVVMSKNRLPIIVNPQGYNYARYIGVML